MEIWRYEMFELGYTIGMIGLPIGLLAYFLKRKFSKPKAKVQSCPNGHNMFRPSDNFCGMCGARLIWK